MKIFLCIWFLLAVLFCLGDGRLQAMEDSHPCNALNMPMNQKFDQLSAWRSLKLGFGEFVGQELSDGDLSVWHQTISSMSGTEERLYVLFETGPDFPIFENKKGKLAAYIGTDQKIVIGFVAGSSSGEFTFHERTTWVTFQKSTPPTMRNEIFEKFKDQFKDSELKWIFPRCFSFKAHSLKSLTDFFTAVKDQSEIRRAELTIEHSTGPLPERPIQVGIPKISTRDHSD